MQLTQKERMYLTDAKHHEELCIAKYNHYTEAVTDPELKQIFRRAGQQETSHLHTVQQILQGRIPDLTSHSMQAQQTTGGGSTRAGQTGSMTERLSAGNTARDATSMVASHTQYTGQGGLSEEQICSDLLTTEKAVSDMYDSAVFESSNQQLRQVLNHIQKEEQDHAFAIFQFMQKKGWYQTQ